MKFRVYLAATGNGNSFHGYFPTSYEKLREKFGPPSDMGDSDGKVSTEWLFLSEHGDVVTLYDYKETILYDREYPSVIAFRSRSSYDWHIGAASTEVAQAFIKWLNDAIR